MVDPTRAVILQSALYVFEKEAEEGKANSLEWNLGSSGTKVRSGMSRAATSPHPFARDRTIRRAVRRIALYHNSTFLQGPWIRWPSVGLP